jgi:hypothetical protein
MEGDKRKGKAAVEPKKKKTDRRRSGTEFFQCQILRVSHRGAFGLERVIRDRGSSPRVSSSHNSSYNVQDRVSSQSR